MKNDILHLDENENVIMEVRKHWIIFLSHTLGLVFSAILPFVAYTIIEEFIPSLTQIDVPGNGYALFVFFYSLWLLFLWIMFFVDWTKYYLDVWYVTEKRIIAVDQRHIFDRGVSNLKIERIQDVTINVTGLIPTFFNFGDVRIQTAGEDNMVFSMSTVNQPDKLKRVLFNRKEQNLKSESNTQST